MSLCVCTYTFSQIPSYVPSNGLKGWWSFTGNADDGSGNGNNGTVNGASITSDRFGNFGNAYSFDGSSSNISVNPITDLDNSAEITISVWALITNSNSSTSQYLISRAPDTGPEHFSIRIDEQPSSYKFSGQIGDNNTPASGVTSSVSSDISQTDWHHVVLTYDGVDVKLYLDGVFQGASPYTGQINPSPEQLYFGMHNDPSFPYYVNGQLDDIGIWNRALSLCEVQDLFNASAFTLDFLQDTLSVCDTNATLIAQDGYTSYLWSTSEINDTITVNQNGWYYCTISDANNCSTMDSVYVSLVKAEIAQNDTIFCEGFGQYTLSLLDTDDDIITWSTAETTSSIQVNPTQTTTYYCSVSDGLSSCMDSMTITILTTTYSELYDTVCNEYTAPSGLLYYTSGTYFDTIPNAAGCDSVLTIYLTVNQNETVSITETVCDMYTQDGQMFMSSGVYSYTIPTVNGCDSLINLDLTVLMSSSNSIVETTCSPYIAPDGQSFTSSGLYNVVIPNSVGCDSNITIDLTILSDSIYLPVSECYSYTAPDGNTYFESGLYTAVFTNQYGCDSTIYIDLSILSNDTSIVETACESYTAPDGQIYATSGVYTAIIPNSFACDSTILIDLTVIYGSPSTITETVCETYTAPDGQVYTTSGVYTAIIPSSQGCDSTIMIDLTVNYNTTNSIVESACGMYTAPDGQMFMTSGIYDVTIPTFSGCDSLITIDLTINQPTSSTINEAVCSSYTAPDGQVYGAAGTYTAIIPNSVGCDSVITINLTINTTTVELFQSACETYTAPDGQVYTVSGTYTAIIPTVLGCDSIITINLSIFTPTFSTITEEACGTYTAPDGQNYTSSGFYTAVIPNFGGCDSTITIDLTINESTQSTIDATSCTQYLAPDGQIYTAPGTYTATIPNAAGCDSVITINLQMNATASTIADTQCIFYIAPDGQTYTVSGTYVAIIPNSIGCDSVIAINLVIVDTANCTDDADLDGVVDNLEILDGTNPYYSCSYIVSSMTLPQLSGADCDMDGIMDTTEINNGTNPFDPCDPNKIGIQCQDGTFIPTGFSPNGIGDAENEKLMLLIGKNVASFTFDIYDRWGHLVFSTSDETYGWDGTYDEKPCNSGVYAYVMNVNYFDKLPEIKTGNITLIR
jgi:gliding motility-associated-like protein